MYYDFTVDIPQVKGKIITRKKGTSTYILFQYGQNYNAEKQYCIPQRTVIGKVSPDDPRKMYPNEKYPEYFPETAMPEELPEAYRSCCLKIGSYMVIRNVLEEYHLPQLLYKRLGSKCGLFLDLVSYLIVDEENAGQYYPDFAYLLFRTLYKVLFTGISHNKESLNGGESYAYYVRFFAG